MNKCKPSLWASVLCTTAVILASCASTADVLVNKEQGYYYGAAFATTEVKANESAYTDLIYNVLTESGSIKNDVKANFVITAEIKDAFGALKLQPQIVEKKSDSRYDVVYRLSADQWAKAEKIRLAKLKKDYTASFEALKADKVKALPALMKDAGALLAAIQRTGAVNMITDNSGALLNDQIEAFCLQASAGLVFTATPETGLIKSGSTIELTVLGKGNKPAALLPLAVTWKSDMVDGEPMKLLTDNKGKTVVTFPNDSDFLNQKVTLTATTDFAAYQKDGTFLSKTDKDRSGTWSYRNSNLDTGVGNAVKVTGGQFTIGAVKQDRRAGSIEKPRKVTVASFYMDRNLVTNGDFKMYLDAVNAPSSEYPDFWDNTDLNQDQQPVIGVSLQDAQKYAAWISSVQGVTKRLPTEAEFEVAARGGKDSIYPWGDELPSQGALATFSGTGKFTTVVGSRENGKNPLGLNDMAGNVWEWTTSLPAGTMSGDQTFNIVKGGSYMDGQYELRISNRQLRDPAERHPDVGFRLVSEVINE